MHLDHVGSAQILVILRSLFCLVYTRSQPSLLRAEFILSVIEGAGTAVRAELRNILLSLKLCLKIVLPIVTIGTTQCYTIIIDPGHGGKFHGGKGYDNLIEKDLNLDIAKRVVSLLEKHKFKVVLTRNKDIELDKDMLKDLKIRSEICKKEKADLFISVHFNHGGRCLSGFEVYVPRCKKFPWQSYCAANHIHFELSKFTEPHWCGTLGNLNENDRGIRAANFHVLRDQHCPAVLVELEYISNKHCAQKIKSEKFKQDLANALAQGITNYVLTK